MTIGNRPDLTDAAYWDAYWQDYALPAEVRRGQANVSDALIEVFDRFLPEDPHLRALEVGGAPGGYLAYLHRRFGYEPAILDNSPVGCSAARRNFELLGIDARVYERDLFDRASGIGRFDLVYSLGLIEHFSDLGRVVEAHLQLIEPGGMLVVGCPNFCGINGRLWRWLAPSVAETVNPGVTDIRTWDRFEHELGLQPVFRGYIGGFDPSLFWRRESDTFPMRALSFSLIRVRRLQERAPRLRQPQSRLWSGYAVGVYRTATK